MSSPPSSTPKEFRRLLHTARRGETLVAAAFAVAVLLLAVGAWAVWRADERHRATANESMMDQASYLAGMVSQSVQQQGWFATRTMLRSWKETLEENRGWPTTDSVRRRALTEAIGPDLPDLIPARFFAGDDNGWRTTEESDGRGDPVLTEALRRSRDTLPKSGLFRMMVIPANRDTALVFLMAAAQPRPGMQWYGFETPLREFRDKIVQPRITALAYSFEADVVSRTVDVHILELRRKLEADPAQPRHVLTVRKTGYRLVREPRDG